MMKSSRISGFLALGLLGLVAEASAQPAAAPAGETAASATAATGGGEATAPTVEGSTTSPATTESTTASANASAASAGAPANVATDVPAVAKADQDDAKQDEAAKPVWERSPKIKVGGYVHTAFIMNDAVGEVANEFSVRNARLSLEWSQGSLLDGAVEVEMAKEVDSEGTSPTWSPLRDAYVKVTPLKLLGFRMGQFKRPFSRIALTGNRTLKLVNRGIADSWVNGELGYGQRDVGLQVEGSYGKNWGVDYAVGVFNGTGRNAREIDDKGAKDFVGRVVGHLGKHVEVGANVANKNWDDPPATVSYATKAWMYGGDVAVDYKGLYGMFEGGYGDNYSSSMDLTKSWYVLGLVAYKIKLTKTWNMAVEPLIKGEILTVSDSTSDTRALAGTAGANLYLGNLFRLMVQGEWIEPTNASALPHGFGAADAMKQLTVQFALHTK